MRAKQTTEQTQQDPSHDTSTYDARLRAAGLDGDWPEDENIDVFRNRLARMIDMFTNNWHGCPEGVCKRQRGCMAPNGSCTNAEPTPEDIWETPDWEQARDDFRRALDERITELGGWEE